MFAELLTLRQWNFYIQEQKVNLRSFPNSSDIKCDILETILNSSLRNERIRYTKLDSCAHTNFRENKIFA